MWIIYDLIIIGIIGLSTFIGYKQGLIKSAVKILSFFIAIIVSIALYKPVSNLIIKNTSIDENIKNAIMSKVTSEDSEEKKGDLTSKIMGEVNNTIDEATNTVSIKIIETGTLLLLFIVVKIGLIFVSVLTDLITKLPILKQINKARWSRIWIDKRNSYSICYFGSSLFGISTYKKRYF